MANQQSTVTSDKAPLSFAQKFAFGMGDFWTSIGNIALATYLTMFYTDVVHIPAAQVATLLLVVRLVVAFWDLSVGILVDKTSTRWGKARPWMLVGGVAYGITFFFLFVNPFSNHLLSIIFAWVTYTLVNIAYSTVNVSYASLTSLMTSDVNEKTQLNIFRMTIANVGALIIYVCAMPFINYLFGSTAMGWSVFFGAIAVLIPCGYWYTFSNTREVNGSQHKSSGTTQSVGAHFDALTKNKYWWITLGLNFALWMYNGIANGMATYIAKYVLGNSNLTTVIGLATVIPLIIGLPFAGSFVKKFGKRNSSLVGLILVAAGSFVVFIDPTNVWIFFASIVIRMIGIIPINAALNAMSADVVDYGEWSTGIRSDGIVFSSSSFSMKIAMGVSAAAIAWILSMSGYDGSALSQSAATVNAIVQSFVWIPVAMVVVMAVLLAVYDLDKKIHTVINELA